MIVKNKKASTHTLRELIVVAKNAFRSLCCVSLNLRHSGGRAVSYCAGWDWALRGEVQAAK
ncbi:hypothetical protein [Massilia eurypsychrophila]|jgi:hypothetical protein|uniref:hypothetical protein n=1 Tax=Massilia eurypsychrophila TaxID=1485217 RepID=UPI001034AF78|nr:hypothetical protein [Massilia eurypsychrophila]